MLEAAFRGGKRSWALVAVLAAVVLAGALAYSGQLADGLAVTGMTRDVTWGLYIAQFTFMVGVAASAVMVVLPYYVHDYKAFGRLVIVGEALAVSAVLVCMTFVYVDMGRPERVLNVMLHPNLGSLMFWDVLSLSGYLVLNLVIGALSIDAERRRAPPRPWIKPLIFLSIPWAVSIHTVTAFLYSGLEARPFWLTAILAPRFLASAFASGPSLLILLALALRRFGGFDVGREAIRKLAVVVAYAAAVNVFFVLAEAFTALYGGSAHHAEPFQYLFVGLEGHAPLVPWMRAGAALSLCCTVLLLFPRIREREGVLAVLAAGVIVAVWIEKGVGLVVAGFVPSPLGRVTTYTPTLPETAIAVGVYAAGLLILTLFLRTILSVRATPGPAWDTKTGG
jgi:molybdopterin-containing oxidoreductase family membrane subunit